MLERFRNLEGKRRDEDEDEPDAPTGSRASAIGRIEPRRTAPTPAVRDPFAPPDDDAEVPLELSHDDLAAPARNRAQHQAHARQEPAPVPERIVEGEVAKLAAPAPAHPAAPRARARPASTPLEEG